MFSSLFGTTTIVGTLRTGLDETSLAHRGIAARVANAQEASAHDDFAQTLAGKMKPEAPVDLEHEMAMLASTQIRYDASARLLQKAYAALHTAVKNNG